MIGEDVVVGGRLGEDPRRLLVHDEGRVATLEM